MGESFGHYRLEKPLGRGGFGEVWLARDTKLDRLVALKMLLPEIRGDDDSAKRFRREARLAAALSHDHIVHLNAFGEIEGRLYIDMVYIEGVDLKSELATAGRFDPTRALHVLDQVADALDAAHAIDRPGAQAMIHRDVKPANVLLARRRRNPDHVYLVDFGVARALAPATIITEPGAVAGTPPYMAPELWEGSGSDHRVDVYSTAVMLFEMLTGRLPFEYLSLPAIIWAHLRTPVPPASAAQPDLPPAIDDVIARGLAKNPEDRYATVGELAEAARGAFHRAATAPQIRSSVTPLPMPPQQQAPYRRAAQQPVSQQPVSQQSVSQQSVSQQSAAQQPVSRQSAAEQSADPPPSPPPGPSPDQLHGMPTVTPSRPATPSTSTGAPPPDPTLWASAGPDPTAMNGSGSEPTRQLSTEPDPQVRAPAPQRREPFLGSWPHFTGLFAILLLIPLDLLGIVTLDWSIFVVAALLYLLGVVLGRTLRRPPQR